MQSVFFPLGVTISVLCIGLLGLVEGKGFSFPNGEVDPSKLNSTLHAQVSSGTLTLDGSKSGAQAFYSLPISLIDPTSKALLSFATFFSYSSNSTSGNGTLAFVVVPDPKTTNGQLSSARKTLSIEFNTSCSASSYNNTPYGEGPGWGGEGGGGGGWGGGGSYGGQMGGFQVIEYANSSSVTPQQVWGYGPNWDGQPDNGPNWDGQPDNGPYFCSQQPGADYPTYQYQVVVEYNATTGEVSVGSPSCGAALARVITFGLQNLSAIITEPAYVGFMVADGAVYNVSQWNFTSNATTSTLTSLALSTAYSTDTNSGSGSDGNSSKKLSKGSVMAFSVLGAGIGVAAVFGVCCFCARKKKYMAKSVHVSKTIADDAIIFDATKRHHATKIVEPISDERDTAPLKFTGTASWLQPVAPR